MGISSKDFKEAVQGSASNKELGLSAKIKQSKPTPDYREHGQYKCHKCGCRGLRLWRNDGYTDDYELECADCLTVKQKIKDKAKAGKLGITMTLDPDGVFTYADGDQLGGKFPATPTPDGASFWGYTSAPNEDIAWWKALPTYDRLDWEIRCREREVVAAELQLKRAENYCETAKPKKITFLPETVSPLWTNHHFKSTQKAILCPGQNTEVKCPLCKA